MTNGEKTLITQRRQRGLGYAEIARKLGMSVNTVKSYCQRNGIKPAGKAVVQSDNTCRQCGNTLQQIPGKKKKQFKKCYKQEEESLLVAVVVEKLIVELKLHIELERTHYGLLIQRIYFNKV